MPSIKHKSEHERIALLEKMASDTQEKLDNIFGNRLQVDFTEKPYVITNYNFPSTSFSSKNSKKLKYCQSVKIYENVSEEDGSESKDVILKYADDRDSGFHVFAAEDGHEGKPPDQQDVQAGWSPGEGYGLKKGPIKVKKDQSLFIHNTSSGGSEVEREVEWEVT